MGSKTTGDRKLEKKEMKTIILKYLVIISLFCWLSLIHTKLSFQLINFHEMINILEWPLKDLM